LSGAAPERPSVFEAAARASAAATLAIAPQASTRSTVIMRATCQGFSPSNSSAVRAFRTGSRTGAAAGYTREYGPCSFNSVRRRGDGEHHLIYRATAMAPSRRRAQELGAPAAASGSGARPPRRLCCDPVSSKSLSYELSGDYQRQHDV
jgi:hypothetical protein